MKLFSLIAVLASAPIVAGAQAPGALTGDSLVTEPAPVDERLASLRRSVGNLSTIDQIVQRYEQFIAQNEGTPLAEAAGEDLALWIDRRARGFVKLDDAWVSPQDYAHQAERTIELAGEARRLVKDGRLREAQDLVRQLLALNPTDPAAHYLRGLIAYASKDLPNARRAFERVLEGMPDHVPSLNNVAVILSRQNQHAAAMLRYGQAMRASPMDRLILDNVAEALGGLPEESRDVRAVIDATAEFERQDRQLQDQMARGGLFRWGATWVSERELADLQQADQELRRRLDRLAQRYDSTLEGIERIDEEVEQNVREMRRLESRSVYRDDDGDLHRTRLPSLYYEIRDDTERLRSRRAGLEQTLEQLRQEAAGVEQAFPSPRYTGVQNLIGPEGTPLMLPAGTGSAPTTAPVSPEVP